MDTKKYTELNADEKNKYVGLIKAGLKRYSINEKTITAEYLANRYKKCFYCDCDLGLGLQSIEHIKNPKSSAEVDLLASDVNNKNNIVLCCRSCNPSKGKKNLKEWLENISNSSLPQEKIAKIKERTPILLDALKEN